jgi:hypothetical protein
MNRYQSFIVLNGGSCIDLVHNIFECNGKTTQNVKDKRKENTKLIFSCLNKQKEELP